MLPVRSLIDSGRVISKLHPDVYTAIDKCIKEGARMPRVLLHSLDPAPCPSACTGIPGSSRAGCCSTC